MKSLLWCAFTLATLAAPAAAIAQRVIPEGDVRSQYAAPDERPRSTDIGPTVLDDRGGSPPPGWRRDRWTHSSWWIGGAVIMGLGYGLTTLVAVAPCSRSPLCQEALVPLAGPFLAIANARSISAGSLITVLVCELAQLTGTALIIAGVAVPRRVFVPILPTLRITPLATAGGNGAEYVVGVGANW